jgi:antitoxin component YwqK of YwqJK toxin-antitoxin module
VIFRQEGWSYDANGDTTVHEEYDAEGSITLRMLMTYYTKGKINSAKSYDVAGNPQLTSQYDNNGNLTEEVIYDVDGSALQSISREYNKENIKIREITKFRGKIISEKYFRVENRIKDKK